MKSTIISIFIALIFIGGSILIVKEKDKNSETINENNVSIVDGKQIIDIRARGGYQPRRSVAKSGIPTTIRFNSQGTFDCSASVRIPSLKISKLLSQSGLTDIDIGTQNISTLKGSCGMGMYPFEIVFN